MSLSHPSAAELIQAIQTFLSETVATQVDGQTAFHLKVANNLLKIVARELTLQQSTEEVIKQQLDQVLRHTNPELTTIEHTLESLNAALCQSISSGTFNDGDNELLSALRIITQAKLYIDNPDYSGLQPGKYL